jgi:hypothetical protein
VAEAAAVKEEEEGEDAEDAELAPFVEVGAWQEIRHHSPIANTMRTIARTVTPRTPNNRVIRLQIPASNAGIQVKFWELCY